MQLYISLCIGSPVTCGGENDTRMHTCPAGSTAPRGGGAASASRRAPDDGSFSSRAPHDGSSVAPASAAAGESASSGVTDTSSGGEGSERIMAAAVAGLHSEAPAALTARMLADRRAPTLRLRPGNLSESACAQTIRCIETGRRTGRGRGPFVFITRNGDACPLPAWHGVLILCRTCGRLTW